jgi:hypothetical protein
MKTFKGVQYVIIKAGNGLMLTIPAFKLSVPVDKNFKESDLFSYL